MRRRGVLGILLGAGLTPGVPGATGGTAAETEIKAAMTFNFTKFIEWPGAKADGPVVIGVAGDDGLRDALEELSKSRAGGGRPVHVKKVEQPGEAEACHLLFIGRGARKRTPEFVAASRRGTVTTGDADGFIKAGGAIGFIVVENKLRFEVNLAAANQAGVTISSRLLRLATEVKP